MPNSLWPWLGIRQPVIKSLGESRENRIMMRDIIHKLDPDGKRGMKQYWNFKDGEDYMRQHFDNVPGLKEAGGLDFLKKHGVWPIYGKLDPRNRQDRGQDRPRDPGRNTACTRRNCLPPTWPARWWSKSGSIIKNGKADRRPAQGQKLRRLPDPRPDHQRARGRVGRVWLQPDAHLQADPVAQGDEGRRVDPHHLQDQRAQAVTHSGGEVAGGDHAQQPGVDEHRDRQEAGREDRRPGARGEQGRLHGDQGLCVRGHPPEGRRHSHCVRPLGLRPAGATQAEASEKGGAWGAADDADIDNNVWWDDKGVHPNRSSRWWPIRSAARRAGTTPWSR